eukprot:6844110-Prymnesium_polylepis.2
MQVAGSGWAHDRVQHSSMPTRRAKMAVAVARIAHIADNRCAALSRTPTGFGPESQQKAAKVQVVTREGPLVFALRIQARGSTWPKCCDRPPHAVADSAGRPGWPRPKTVACRCVAVSCSSPTWKDRSPRVRTIAPSSTTPLLPGWCAGAAPPLAG